MVLQECQAPQSCLPLQNGLTAAAEANLLKFYEMEGLRAVPVQVDIKVVPVQDEKGSIEKMDAPESPALEFKPEVNQG